MHVHFVVIPVIVEKCECGRALKMCTRQPLGICFKSREEPKGGRCFTGLRRKPPFMCCWVYHGSVLCSALSEDRVSFAAMLDLLYS